MSYIRTYEGAVNNRLAEYSGNADKHNWKNAVKGVTKQIIKDGYNDSFVESTKIASAQGGTFNRKIDRIFRHLKLS